MRRTDHGPMLVALFGALAVALLLAGCGPASGAPKTVDQLLRLRSTGSTDPAAYAEFVAEQSVADALAQDALARDAGGDPLPGWETPRVVEETSGTVVVLVRWKKSPAHPGWPESTSFAVRSEGGVWKIVDASAEPASDASKPESSPPAGK